MQKLDEASPILKMVNIGTSPQGKEMYIAMISSEENIQNLDKLKGINKELALNPNLLDAQNLPSGIYFYSIKAEDKTAIKKMTLLK